MTDNSWSCQHISIWSKTYFGRKWALLPFRPWMWKLSKRFQRNDIGDPGNLQLRHKSESSVSLGRSWLSERFQPTDRGKHSHIGKIPEYPPYKCPRSLKYPWNKWQVISLGNVQPLPSSLNSVACMSVYLPDAQIWDYLGGVKLYFYPESIQTKQWNWR